MRYDPSITWFMQKHEATCHESRLILPQAKVHAWQELCHSAASIVGYAGIGMSGT
jgi:hypothetical protein